MNRLLILIVSLVFVQFGWSQQSLSLTEAIMEGLQNVASWSMLTMTFKLRVNAVGNNCHWFTTNQC